MISNGNFIETTLLNKNQEIILTGSISKLSNYTGNNYSIKYDSINIFYTGDYWILQYSTFKSLIGFMKSREDTKNFQYTLIKLLVADELKILTLIETMSIGLLEAVYLLHIEGKNPKWEYYS